MKFTGPFLGLLLISTLADYVNGECSLCGKQNDENRTKRSIDLTEVLDIPTYRLPHDVRPTEYELEIKPDIANANFTGQVHIKGRPLDNLNTITLNTHNDLNIIDIKIEQSDEFSKNKTVIDVVNWEVHQKKSECTITMAQNLVPMDNLLISITYSGNIRTNDSLGFFKKEYMSSTGQTHAFVATQLRPANARRWFPCWDEPEYKAVFSLRIARPKNMIARSNTPISKSIEMPGDPEYVMDHFEKTPKMSTYQLALLISDFESIAPTLPVDEMNGTKLEIKVWGRKEYLDAMEHVPNKVVRIVNYLQKYFNKSISLPKLDLVAMPMYTATKASDSWGLMFFRESELSSSFMWNTAYELMYQWIGQQITPYRWSDAQLNKALNSFLASKITVDIEPDEMEGKWPITMLYSLYYELGRTLPFDRVVGIRNEVSSAKTELLFRMFNYTLGEERFRRGIQKLIAANANLHNVFDHLNKVVNETNFSLPPGLTIHDIAAPWMNRDRVPLVTVNRDYETGYVTFTQTVYLREAPPRSNEKMSYQWDIPIVVMTEDKLDVANYTPYVWMTKAGSPIVKIKDIAQEDKFIIVNPEEIGMFPVQYDSCNWKKIGEFLQGPNREMIPVLTRAKLLHDSWNLAYAGNLCFETALNMTLFLKNERSHVVWEPVFPMIDHVGRRIAGTNVHPKFEAYICSLLRPLSAELGETPKPGESSWKTHMRGLVKNFLCRAGHEPCVSEAREQFKKWMTDDEPDRGNPVANEFLCPVFRWGTREEWEFGLQRVINFPRNTPERKQNERTYLLKTLAGCPKDKEKVERLLNVMFFDRAANFTRSDIHLIYSTLTGDTVGHWTFFEFLKEKWPLVRTLIDEPYRMVDGNRMWRGLLSSATGSFNTQEGYDKVFKLYETMKEKSEADNDVFEEALSNIEKEIGWNTKHGHVMDEWLNAHLSKKDLADLESVSTTTAAPSTITTGTSSTTAPIAG